MQQQFKLAALAAAVVSAFNAHAADQETVEPEVVVTATRQPQRANALLADVTVLERRDIELAGQTTLPELLAQQRGVQLSSNGGAGASSSIFIRGANSDHTLVLIDGMRVNSATTGTTTLENIPLAEIDHIEILRGPASALYGSEAIGGVIQIFTRKGEGKPHFDAFAGYGTYNAREIDAGYGGSNEGLSYSLRAGVFSTDGFSATNSPVAFGYNPDKDGFLQRHANASLSYKLGALDEVGAQFLYSGGYNQYDNGAGTFDDLINKRLTTSQVYLKHGFTEIWSSTFKLGKSVDDSVTIGAAGNSVFRTDQNQFSWQNDFKLPVGQALLAYEYDKQDVTSTTAYPITERTLKSLLAGWTANVGAHGFQLNVRHDDNSQFGGKTTGLGSYGYQFNKNWRAYASIGTAFKAPTFNQLYFPFFGNPLLKPEYSRNKEVGIVWDTAPHSISLTYFNNKIDNLIAFDSSTFLAGNINKATIEGETIAYSGRIDDWTVSASIDIMQARDDTTHKRLIRRADQIGHISASRQLGPWTIGGEINSSGLRYDNIANTRKLGGYTVVNAFANYAISPEWKLELRGNNVGDRQYELARGYNTPDANAFIGLRYTPK